MIEIELAAWLAEAKARFGADSRDWRFVCLACGNVQSVRAVVERKPDLKPEDVAEWIHFSCEGRTNKARGCNWTLGGLFHLHELEVLAEGKARPSFVFEGSPNGLGPFYTPRQEPATKERPHVK